MFDTKNRRVIDLDISHNFCPYCGTKLHTGYGSVMTTTEYLKTDDAISVSVDVKRCSNCNITFIDS